MVSLSGGGSTGEVCSPTDCPRVLPARLVISRHEQAGLVTEVIRPYYGLLGLYNHLEDQVEGGTVR